jgi:hypothetical protein
MKPINTSESMRGKGGWTQPNPRTIKIGDVTTARVDG